MNFKYIISSLFLLFLAFGACTEDERGLETQGYLELGVSKNVEVITRGFDVEDQSLAVDICAGSNDSIVKHFSDYNDMAGDRVLLDVGTYKVKVSSNPTSKLEFEQPTFYGEKTNVAVTAGKTTAVSVECFLSCVKVTTEFTKPVQNMFKSVIARISDKSGSYLDYGLKETRAGYFQPGYILVDLTLTNKEGLEFKMSKLIDKTEARDHYHLVFDMIDSGDDNSGMDFDITIEDDPTNDENHTVTIPLPETGYGQEPPVVVVKESGVSGDGIIALDKGDAQSLLLEISSTTIGLSTVTMYSTSTYFDEKEIPVSLDLMNLTAENNEKLNDIGLSPELSEDKTSFKLDFSKLIPQLSGGTHSFVFSARDNMGHESIQEIRINVNLSIMTKNVLTEDIWAHYVTLRGYVKNATEEDKDSYKFQYKKVSDEEDVWIDATSVDVLSTPDAEGSNITKVVTSLAPGTEYVYRLVVDDSPAADMAYFTTEEAVQLPNSGFEDWCKNSDGLSAPWKEGETSFWQTGNSKVFGVAAEMTKGDTQNTWDNGVGCAVSMTSSWETIKFAAGNIFSGDFELIKNGLTEYNGKLTLGRDFYVRPIAFNGYYKYNPADVVSGKGSGSHLAAGDKDLCSIYVALTDERIIVDTGTKQYFDSESTSIIAYGVLSSEEEKGTNGEYKSFSIPFIYRNNRKPKYIIVVASSSKYGDYFEGGDGSQMWLDKVSLEYPQSPSDVTYKK